MTTDRMRAALEDFIEAIESTGGIKLHDGLYVPVVDEDWPDLASAYTYACDALDRAPVLA